MLLGLSCLLLIVAPQLAAAQPQAFDFLGQAMIPSMVGGSLSMYSTVQEGSSTVVPPIPLDYANYDYTIVVTHLVLDSDGMVQYYSNGAIVLYEDNMTVADYANLSTFTDGTAILVGTISTLTRSVSSLPIPPFTTTISINGTVDWTGGTRLSDIAPADQLNWSFLAAGNVDPVDVMPGFDEQWDGKVEPKEPIVGNDDPSFGDLKSGYQR